MEQAKGAIPAVYMCNQPIHQPTIPADTKRNGLWITTLLSVRPAAENEVSQNIHNYSPSIPAVFSMKLLQPLSSNNDKVAAFSPIYTASH